MDAEHLGVLERAFVAVERPGLPMHVGGLAVLDPAGRAGEPIRPAELRRRLRAMLRDLPRLRARLDRTPLDLTGPAWIPDAAFDVTRHVECWTLPPGSGRRELLRLAGELHARPLPRDRPLWRMALIDGLAGGRQALLTTTHHAITDGIAGVELTRAVFDRPRRSPDRAAAPAGNFFGSGAGRSLSTRLLQAAAGAARYLAGGPVAVPGPFNGPVGPRRALATADLRLADAIAIKRQLGGSVDDVVLASVALALGAHLRRAGWETEGLRLRTMVPVAIPAARTGLGNHVTATFLDLPVDEPAVPCLHRIAADKAMHRAWHEPLGIRAALDAAGLAPPALAMPLSWLLSSLPAANLIVSDVPGPAEPMCLLGARMVGAYPLMPLTASIGLSIAVVTIAGVMGVGITTDPDLVPGGDELAHEIEEAFGTLLHVAVSGSGPRRTRVIT
ncbi:MAG TPA: wax ester/triacylglycerol synthase domain-containing protein [Candidatus Dormibacteraeota bacterium]